MRSSSSRAVLLFSLLATSACVQTPAQVDMKGHYVFGKHGAKESTQRQYVSAPQPALRSYSSAPAPRAYEPVYTQHTAVQASTQRTVGIQSVGVTDLAPPKKDNVWASKATETTTQWNDTKAQASQTASKWKPTGETFAKTETKVKSKTKSVLKSAKGKKVDLITQPRKSGFIWPVNGKKVLSSYGPKGSGKANDGMNIAAAQGEPVWAVADGEVIFVGDELSGYGNMVLIKHAGSNTTTYAHLNQSTVDKYDRVKQGDIIGYVGSTGNVNRPQLYFAVREGKQNVNPQTFLSRSMAGL